jgi:tripartite-type tricarboxylate transporter receptor subunit TctC
MNYFWRVTKSAFITMMVPADGHQANAKNYPNRPIRFIVPFAAGGPGDILARILGQEFTKAWGQPVTIDIKHGLNGITGSDLAAKASPDGYTIAIAASAHYINPSIYRTLPFDPVTDFAPVSLVASGPNVLVVHPSVPAQSLREFIAYAKQHPGRLKYASGGHGSPSHLAGELFNTIAGVDIPHVPYAGHAAAGAALSDGREVQLMYDAAFTCMKHVKSGKWRALGVTTPKRASAFPDLPTMIEAGLAGCEVSPAMGVLAPAGTPKEIVDLLSREIARIVNLPEVKAKIRADGGEPIGNAPEQYAAYVKSEIGKWAKVVKDAGIEILDLPK